MAQEGKITSNLPENWEDSGTEIPAGQRSWEVEERPPAGWFNYFFYHVIESLKDLDQNAIKNESNIPALYLDLKANRPDPALENTLFISTDSKEIFRDTGSSWEEISAKDFLNTLKVSNLTSGIETIAAVGKMVLRNQFEGNVLVDDNLLVDNRQRLLFEAGPTTIINCNTGAEYFVEIITADSTSLEFTNLEVLQQVDPSTSLIVCYNDSSDYVAYGEGYQSIAWGRYAHAEGYQTNSSGMGAHAEGRDSIARGYHSHAEGDFTIANGHSAHAEGSHTVASGDYAHTEGNNTQADGRCAHAEGYETLASASGAHAEGYYTQASGLQSHAEGRGSIASGNRSHAEGSQTEAIGDNAHAEGANTTAEGVNAHAEGGGSIASGDLSHAEGNTCLAKGINAHAEGAGTTAEGANAHSEGANTTAIGANGHAEGAETIAQGANAHAEGYKTLASGGNAHAEGEETKAIKDGAHAEGYFTEAKGVYAHAEGYKTVASGERSHAEGDSTVASGFRSHAEGDNTKASGNTSHAEGSYTTASGHYAHAEGGSTTASGYRCHAEGDNTTASGYGAHAEGYNTLASHGYSHIMGEYGDTKYNDAWHLATGGPTDHRLGAVIRPEENGAIGYATHGWRMGAADYAEYFEWYDQNPNAEKRYGYFVTLAEENPEQIRIAKGEDDVLGVVSVKPGVIGDAQELYWQGKYLKNQWGETLYEEAELPAVYEELVVAKDEQGQNIVEEVEVKPARIIKEPLLNPDFDPKKEYSSRGERSEWDPIGLMGKLRVRQDGSCVAGGYCRPNQDGIATKADSGYRVMKVINDQLAYIIFK